MPSHDAQRLPLLGAQRGVWFGQRLNPASPLYNAAECIEIRGPLDLGVFERALRQAVAETDAVNVTIESDGEQIVQFLRPVENWVLEVLDLTQERDPDEVVGARIEADLRQVIDIGRGPLFAHMLFIVAPTWFIWYHRCHHIALDGYSFVLVARRVAELYNAHLIRTAPASAPFGSLRTAIDDELGYNDSSLRSEDEHFWRAYFRDRPGVVSLSSRISVSCGRLLRHSGRLRTDALARLEATGEQAGATWPEVVLGLIASYVYRTTGAGEVVIGVVMMGRMGSPAARIPAMMMNVAPLRIRIRTGAPLVDIVRTVRNEMRTIRSHQRYRVEQLRRDLKLLGGGRRLYGPLVNVMPFDYGLDFGGHQGVARNISAGGEFIEDIAIHLCARHDGQSLHLDIDANPRGYTQAELAEHFLAVGRLIETVGA